MDWEPENKNEGESLCSCEREGLTLTGMALGAATLACPDVEVDATGGVLLWSRRCGSSSSRISMMEEDFEILAAFGSSLISVLSLPLCLRFLLVLTLLIEVESSIGSNFTKASLSNDE